MNRDRTQVVSPRRNHQGFTLIELMIVLVVVALLAAVAMPAYTNYTIRAKIPDATSVLANKRVQMEQYFQDNHTYAAANVGAGPCVADSSNYFTYSCTVLTAATYTLAATGKNPGPMAGFTYYITQNNAKSSTIAVPAPTAWINTSNTCWISKAGEKC